MSASNESAVAKQKRLIQQEIAKLSGAISRHAGPSRPTSYTSEHRPHPYASSRGGPSRGRGRGRGRGGGRGGSYALDLRQTNPKSASATAANPPAALAPTTQEREEGEMSPEPPALPSDEKAKEGDKDKEDDPENWVKRTSKGGNMSLMTVQKSNTLASKPKPRIPRPPRIPPQIQVLNSTAGPSGANRVVIDGVIFQFEEGGSKLTRIGEVTPQAGSLTATGTPTRRSLDYGGQKFRRTSKGNLVAANRRAELANKPCRYFTKTGRCNRALTCPFAHNPARVAICPKFLRSTCPNTASSCPLSHIPSPHNTPSCIHFQATASCRNGDACIYPHVKVADNAPVCELFARGGWCDREAGTCPEMHVWECGEWRARGVCSKGGKCGLRHVLRAEKGKGKGSAQKAEQDGLEADQEMFTTDVQGARDVPVEGGFEEQDDFIELDHGSPADPESEPDESEDDEESEGEAEAESDSDDTLPAGKHAHPSSPTPDMSEDEDEEDEVLGIVM